MDQGEYKTEPKSSPVGAGTINPFIRKNVIHGAMSSSQRAVPVRIVGESEVRHSASEAMETTSASKALIFEQEPLQNSEYVNRKVEAKRAALREEGLSGAEIDRKMVYDKAESRRLREESESNQQLQDLQLLDLPEYHDLFNRRFKSITEKIDVLEEHIQKITEAKEPHWELRVIRLSKAIADIPVEPKVVVEPPPPPPVLDFTTGDLEIPERFIIKDLDGFKFDPETKFDGLNLPYESCLFVLGTELKAVVLATQEEEDVLSLKLLSEQKSDIPWHATATLYARLKGDRAETKWIKTARSLDKRLAMVSSVLAFIAGEQLNELQIETVITAPEGRDIPPPKPGFCYNVVHLTQGKKGKRKDWQGGTHASPREHKRRGYWWPGKHGPIWIKPTIVNKGVLGRVDKEYHVTKVEVTKE